MILNRARSEQLLELMMGALNEANRNAQRSKRRSRLRRIGIAAAGLTGLTVASAGISSHRRREEAGGDS
jgi:hypothetical protein